MLCLRYVYVEALELTYLLPWWICVGMCVHMHGGIPVSSDLLVQIDIELLSEARSFTDTRIHQ